MAMLNNQMVYIYIYDLVVLNTYESRWGNAPLLDVRYHDPTESGPDLFPVVQAAVAISQGWPEVQKML